MQLRPKMAAQFKQTMETAILRVLKRRPGFQDELVLIAPDGHEAVGISLWDNQQNAEAYARQWYPEVQQMLSKVTNLTPEVKSYQVSIATFEKKKAATSGGGAAA